LFGIVDREFDMLHLEQALFCWPTANLNRLALQNCDGQPECFGQAIYNYIQLIWPSIRQHYSKRNFPFGDEIQS